METNCSNCGRRIRIGDEHAGKAARCPHCQNIFQVPFSSTPSPVVEAPRSDAGTRWKCRGMDGITYGPVSKSELDRWVAEGRVTSDYVIAAEGTEDWRKAVELYPELQRPTLPASPFANQPASVAGAPYAPNVNPYATPRTSSLNTPIHPHRGPLILTLGLLSLVCCQCLGPIAWILAAKDLREMQRGIRDPEGRGLTQAGLVLGIIGSIIVLLTVLANLLALLAAAGR